MIFNNTLEMIGNTPVIKLSKLVEENWGEVYVKLEKYNPGGSIKDRAALGMIEKAEKEGKLKKGDIIIEPTSGNTGIGLAMIGRLKGYKVIVVMPDTMSIERRNLIKAYGAELILTEGAKGMKGAISKAEELAKDNPSYFIPQQFNNEGNPQKHYETTALELIEDIGDMSVLIAAVGTGGTISGIGKKLKEFNKEIKVMAVEPLTSNILSGGNPGPHKIQGIGAGFIPDIYNKDVVDEVITISDEEACKMAAAMAREEGILVGISAGANIAAAVKVAQKLGKGKKIVTVAPDGGEKYLSTGIYD